MCIYVATKGSPIVANSCCSQVTVPESQKMEHHELMQVSFASRDNQLHVLSEFQWQSIRVSCTCSICKYRRIYGGDRVSLLPTKLFTA